MSAIILLSSCASGNEQNEGVVNADTTTAVSKPAYTDAFTKGAVIDTVLCNADKQQSYALYLPSYYTKEKPFPCIVFYDAHARGSLPLYTYQHLAEKYGFVIVGSNISKNGTAPAVTEYIVKTLMDDINTRIYIDQSRMYLSGFSGGARVASSVAMTDGSIAGVIGCSAGFANTNHQPRKFDYIGTAGDYDINWAEMQQLDQQLQQEGFTHQLLTFKGIHAWPPAADMETAILWMQVNAIKEHKQSANDALVAALKKDYDMHIVAASKDPVKQHQLLNGAVQTLKGLADVTTYEKQLTTLNNSIGYKDAPATQAQLMQEERQQKEELSKQFPAQNVVWWQNRIDQMNRSIHSPQTQPRAAEMNQRVLNYLGMICYLYTDHAWKEGDLTNAADYLAIFKKADPKNPDCDYLSAILFVKQGNNTAAISALKDAARLGYDNIADVLTESVFEPLHNDAGFNQAVAAMKQNLKK